MEHRPVLWRECLEGLNVRGGGIYVDCTLGGGGHAEKILERSSPDGRLIGIDRDPEAVNRGRKRLAPFADRVNLIPGNLRELGTLVRGCGFNQVDGILMDLGISAFQLATPLRGFGFQVDAPLDMRMNQKETIPTAQDLVNRGEREMLRQILVEYGEEKRWPSIVKAILRARETAPIRTTRELAVIVEKALPGARRYKIHPATRTFQALRIAVNDELNALKSGLGDAVELLKDGGRLCVISFHSLEDRIIKHFFQSLEKGCSCPPALAVCRCGKSPVIRKISRRPLRPAPQEVQDNPSSRSAKLRVAEKISETS
jgi:16S rRNA (cytosine1402-N4)-methyltransferase